MRQQQINRIHLAARAHRHQDDDLVLPVDPRDPDVVRAKRLQLAARLRDQSSRGTNS
jgi:hypothetical protein